VNPYSKFGFLVPLTFLPGLLFVYGGKREWKWLIDPPDHFIGIHPTAFIRAFFGKCATKVYAIVSGWIMLAIALWELLFL
jgi:heme/copper-type cytochrome/quinol oxidase subunit 3